VGFNPRPHTAGDQVQQSPLFARPLFQSTPAHGGRQKKGEEYEFLSSFNPRPHTAGDTAVRHFRLAAI